MAIRSADSPPKETKARILTAALDLFRERGFAETTMREIAATAGVATGLAYYYFESKNAIVLAFYQRAMEDLPDLLAPAHSHKRLDARLRALIDTKFSYFAPNRRFLGALMGQAADPQSPLSPFGADSAAVRGMDFRQFARALEETGVAVPKELRSVLPQMLWFYQMGLILFWIYDRSEGQRRTRELLDLSLPMVVTLIKASNLPLLGPARRAVQRIVLVLEEAVIPSEVESPQRSGRVSRRSRAT